MDLEQSKNEDCEDFTLPLPPPHEHICLTRPRQSDAPAILPILSDKPLVGIWMGPGVPCPHELHHAQRWLASVMPACDVGQEDWRRREILGLKIAEADTEAEASIGPHGSDIGRCAAGSVEGAVVIRECPVRIIREMPRGMDASSEGIYLGDLGLFRWKFSDISDKAEREREITQNMSKNPGDPSIIWTIGYYLRPSHHGRGIMKSAIRTLLAWAAENMNVRHLRTSAIEGNFPSLSVLKQNGFVVERILPEYAVKGEEKVGLVVLEKRIVL